jgi:hypothetical protein
MRTGGATRSPAERWSALYGSNSLKLIGYRYQSMN